MNKLLKQSWEKSGGGGEREGGYQINTSPPFVALVRNREQNAKLTFIVSGGTSGVLQI